MIRFIVLFILFANCVYCEEWPKWRGPKANGISQETGILKNWPTAGPKKLWHCTLGEGFSGISIAKNIAITIYGDKVTLKPIKSKAPKKGGFNFDIENKEKDKYEYAIALDAKTGKVIWKTKLNNLYYNQLGNGPRSTPTIDEEKVYVLSGTGNLFCLSLKNGKKIWNVNLLKKFAVENLIFGASSSPFVYKDMIIHNVGAKKNSIVAFNKNTGEVLWSFGNDTASYSTPIAIDLFGRKQILFFNGYGIVSVDPEKKEYVWRVPWKTYYQTHAATPIYYNNHVYISSGYNTGAGLIKLENKAGTILPKFVWKTPKMKNHFSSSILWKNHIYGFHNRILKCMDFYSSKAKWIQRGFGKGSIIAIDNHMVILAEDGALILAQLNAEKYKQKSHCYPFGKKTKCWTVPSISDGKLFIRDQETLLCLKIK